MPARTFRSTWSACAAAAIIALGLSRTAGLAASPPPAATLRSFYTAQGTSFGMWGQEIVSVEPVGHDARVRIMSVAPVNWFCPEIRVVQAAERLVPRSTVQAIAGIHICDMSQETIDKALARSKTPPVGYIDYMGSGTTVVADCDGQQRVLELRDWGRA